MTAKGARKQEWQQYLKPREVSALLYAAKGMGAIPYLLMSTQFLLGLRVGEVILLRYEHLGPLSPHGYPEYVNVPTLKKSADNAEGPVCPITERPLIPVPVLSHPNMILAAFNKAYRPESRSSWIFPGGHSDRDHISRSYAIQAFCRARDKAGLPSYVTTHALRHTASVMLSQACGDNELVVGRFLRHSRGSTASGSNVTRRYMHITMERFGEFRGALNLPPIAPLPGGVIGV